MRYKNRYTISIVGAGRLDRHLQCCFIVQVIVSFPLLVKRKILRGSLRVLLDAKVFRLSFRHSSCHSNYSYCSTGGRSSRNCGRDNKTPISQLLKACRLPYLRFTHEQCFNTVVHERAMTFSLHPYNLFRKHQLLTIR